MIKWVYDTRGQKKYCYGCMRVQVYVNVYRKNSAFSRQQFEKGIKLL